jgi:hypothetical protein
MSSRQPSRSVGEYLAFLHSEIERLKQQSLQSSLLVGSSGSSSISEGSIIEGVCTIINDAPLMADQEIVDCIYKWDEGVWAPDAFPESTGKLTFSDSVTGNYANLFLVISEATEYHDNMPLLVCDQGMVVKKDLSVGGYGAFNQGAIYLGSRMGGVDDPPKIRLMHSALGFDTLFIQKMDGTGANLAAATLSLDSPTAPILNFKNSGTTQGIVYHDGSNMIFASTVGGVSFASATGYVDPYGANYKLGYYTPFADVYGTNLHGALTDVQALSVMPRGTSGYVLTAQGVGSAPVWAVPQTATTRSGITDFWSTPFWSNIPDKPSAFAPSAHASSHAYGGSDQVLPQGLASSSQPTFAGLYVGSAYFQYVATSPAHVYLDTPLQVTDFNSTNASISGTLYAGTFNLGSASLQYVATPPAHVYVDTSLHVGGDFNSTNAAITNTLYAGLINLGSASLQYISDSPAHVYIDTALQLNGYFGAPSAHIGNIGLTGTAINCNNYYDVNGTGSAVFHGSLTGNAATATYATSAGSAAGGRVDWRNITNKPSTFTPSSHNQSRSTITDFWSSSFWSNIPDKPSTFTPSAHNHAWSDITSGVPSSFTPSAHASSHGYGGSDQISVSYLQVTGGWNNAVSIPFQNYEDGPFYTLTMYFSHGILTNVTVV